MVWQFPAGIGVGWLRNIFTRKAVTKAMPKKGPGWKSKLGGGAAMGAGWNLMQGNNLPPGAMGASGMGNMGGRSFGGGMGGAWSGGMGGVNAAQATSALQDGDSSNAVVNAIQDLKEVVVSIKGDTATIATGIFGGQGKAEQPPSENAVRGMFGGSSSGLGAGAAAGAGIGGAMALMLLKNIKDSEKDGDMKEFGEDWVNNVQTKATEAYERVKDFMYDTEEGIVENVTSWADSLSSTIRGLTSKIDTIGGSLKSTLIDGPLKAAKTTFTAGVDAFKNMRANRAPIPTPSDAGPTPRSNVVDINTRKAVDPETLIKKIPEAANDAGGAVMDQASKLKIAKHMAIGLGKYGAKMVPLAGAAAGAYFTAERFNRGDTWGALAEGVGVLLPSVIGGISIDAGLLANDVYNSVYGMNEDGSIDFEKYAKDQINDPEGTAARYGVIFDMAKKGIGELIENRLNPPYENAEEYMGDMEDLGQRPEETGNMLKDIGLGLRQSRWDKKEKGIIRRAANTKNLAMMFPEMADSEQFDNAEERRMNIPKFDPADAEFLKTDLMEDQGSVLRSIAEAMSTDPNAKQNVITTEEAQELAAAYREMAEKISIMSAQQLAAGVNPELVAQNMNKAQTQGRAEMKEHITRAVERVDYSPFDPQVAGVMLSSGGIESIRKTFTQ